MNVFELFAVLTLQKDGYEKGLKSASVLTKTEADKMKNSLLEMKNANKTAMDNLIKDFASGKINITDYNNELSKIKSSNSEIENTAKSMGISLEDGAKKSALAWGAVATAIVVVAKKLNQLLRDTLNYADSVGDLAAQYGVSTDAISEMQYIADQSSTSVEQLTSSMAMLYNRAKTGKEVFEELGVSVTDNNGNFKAMDELFWETVGVLNSFEDDAEKSSYMLDLFGRAAMNNGEVLRKTTSEIKAMRQEAHDLGIVMSEETINYASDMNDAFAVLKLQGKSALASLATGAPDAEEKLQKFLDSLLGVLEEYIPTLVSFALRLVIQMAIGIVRIAPSLAVDIISVFIDTLLETDWLQVGIDIGKAIIEGLLNIVVSALNLVLGIFGVKIPKIQLFDRDAKNSYFDNVDMGESYEISESLKQDINVKVEASGDGAVNQETAEKTAEALAPYIDKILGGK